MSSQVRFFNMRSALRALAPRRLHSRLVVSPRCARPSWILVSGLCLLVSACGFEPMYGDAASHSHPTPLQGNLIIPRINSGHEGQLLKTALDDRLNPEGITTNLPEYRLQVTLGKSLIPSVIKSDATIQRYDVRYDSSFSLIRISDNKTLLTGTLRHTGSYNVATNANFATYEAGEDVSERTLKELAEDYVLRLSGYFGGK